MSSLFVGLGVLVNLSILCVQCLFCFNLKRVVDRYHHRVFMPFPRTGNMDVVIVCAWNDRVGTDGLANACKYGHAWMLWPFTRAGNMDVVIVRSWLLWQFPRTGNMDAIIVRAGLAQAKNTSRFLIFFR